MTTPTIVFDSSTSPVRRSDQSSPVRICDAPSCYDTTNSPIADVGSFHCTLTYDRQRGTTQMCSVACSASTLTYSPPSSGLLLDATNHRTIFVPDKLSPEEQFVSKVLSLLEA